MSALERLQAEAGARRAEVIGRLDTGEQAMATSLDKILVRAASSGTTSVGAAAGPPPSPSSPPPGSPSTGAGSGPWIAGVGVVLGVGVLVVAVATANRSDASESAAPAATASAAEVATPVRPQARDAEPAASTQPSSTVTPTVPPAPIVTAAEGSTPPPVLIPTDTVDTATTTGGNDATGGDTTATTRGNSSSTGAVAGSGGGSSTGADTGTPTGSTTTGGGAAPSTAPPRPPSATCGSAAGLPRGAAAVIADAGDFDGDGVGDAAGLYNTAAGASVVIDRSSSGLTRAGVLGPKPVGDLSSGASIRGVRPEGSEFDIGLVIDDLDDDGASVWVRPFALAGCLPTALELPATLAGRGSDVWNGASYTAEGRDFGLQCLTEGDLTTLTYLDNNADGALLTFIVDAPSLEPSSRTEATNPGCWT